MLFIVVIHLALRELVSRHATETEKTNILNEHNMIKNPNWREADQLGMYKL